MLVRDILKIENKRKVVKKQIYQRIFDQFTRKIRTAVELGQKQVFLHVPAFLFGFPTFDRAKATDYLKRQLELSGFSVSLISDYELYASWAKTKVHRESHSEPERELPNLANLRKLALQYGSAPHRR
jgi:hypothetical protein